MGLIIEHSRNDGFSDETGSFLPHPATLHHFAKYHLDVDGPKRIMALVRTALIRWADKDWNGIIAQSL
jgi:hypothetical protein